MEVQCQFENVVSDIDNETYFVCGVKDQTIQENHDIKFIGKHEVGRSKYDVASIYFHNCEITKVPQGLTKIFPNLKIMDIRISNLKNITRSEMSEYKNLREFRCYLNQIEFLPGDLFEDFKNIEIISFYGNNLQIIEPNILDGLTKLKFVDFRENVNYNKCFSIIPQLKGNATLDELKNELREKFFALNQSQVKEFCYKLQQKIQNLKESKEKLYEKNQKLKSKLDNEKSEKSTLTKNFENQIESLTTQIKTGIFADLKNHSQNDDFKDFKIVIDEREFYVHKFLLAARSPTLADMLYNNPEARSLNLADISIDMFEIILKFIYNDELPQEAFFTYLFATASQLKIEGLKNYSAKKLSELLNSENALEILNLSNKYEHEELRQQAYNQIKISYPKIEFKDEWITQVLKLSKIVEAFKEKEAAEKKLKEAISQNSMKETFI